MTPQTALLNCTRPKFAITYHRNPISQPIHIWPADCVQLHPDEVQQNYRQHCSGGMTVPLCWRQR
jgi:hypothetical protein